MIRRFFAALWRMLGPKRDDPKRAPTPTPAAADALPKAGPVRDDPK